MIITDDARVVLTEMLKENGQDTLHVALQQSCCGSSVYFTFINCKQDDKLVKINGINVLMDNEAAIKADSITLKADSYGELLIEDSARPSGGCC